MEVDSDDHPPKKKRRLANVANHASSSSVGAGANGESFSKLKREGTESADERVPGNPLQMIQRFDLMNIRDMKNKAQAVQTVEFSNGKLFYFITL